MVSESVRLAVDAKLEAYVEFVRAHRRLRDTDYKDVEAKQAVDRFSALTQERTKALEQIFTSLNFEELEQALAYSDRKSVV